MHGTIFTVVNDKKLIDTGDSQSFWSEEDLMELIPRADYVLRQDEQALREAAEMLADWASVKVSFTKVKSNGQDLLVAFLDRKAIEGLRDAFRKEKKARIKDILEEASGDPSHVFMWRIAHRAYNESSFYFSYIDDAIFYNEMDFLEDVLEQQTGLSGLYITEVFDCHF